MTSFVSEFSRRGIFNDRDLDSFKNSATYKELLMFVSACCEAVKLSKVTDDFPVCDTIAKFQIYVNRLQDLVDEIPPLQQPMRFGNKAFRTWHGRLVDESNSFLSDLLPSELKEIGYVEELAQYLNNSFGNETRIDYGTGHEMTITIFFLCLFKLGMLQQQDFKATILCGFACYIRCMRKIQETYMLEPAGSHGVWGLDDYHCLTFLWGAAQLIGNTEIRPSSIHDPEVLREEAKDYLYLEGIAFIRKIKSSAPFSETSPMLNDISTIADWTKVCAGLLRLFQGEVLSKRPVVQHLLFGRLFPCTWTVTGGGDAEGGSVTDPTIAGARPAPTPTEMLGMEATRAPWAK